jgi:pheromone shutdown protein TraB
VQPNTVVVELCDVRAARLMSPDGSKPSTLADALAALGAPGSLASKLLGLSMKGFYAAWRHAGLEPGLEFKVRYEATALVLMQR